MLLLITIVIGVTYAAYLVTLQSGENSITTGLVSMSYTESTNVITIENALPMSDADGKNQEDYFDFSVTSNITLNENDPDTKVNYSIELETLSYGRVNNVEEESNTDLDEFSTKVLPNKKSYDITQMAMSTEITFDDTVIKLYLEDITNNKVLIDSKLISSFGNDVVKTIYKTNHTHKYNTNSITTKYRLRAWIDYNVDASYFRDNDYEYKFRINVNGDAEVKSSLTIPEGSSLETIANQVQTMNISYKYTNDANVIENGIAYNVNDNGVFLYEGTDDNGGDYPIYYYRGNVDNNNVLFANMCWKIVRTTSTGGTKLIYNGLPDEVGACNNTGEDSMAFGSVFNENYKSPADVGYMYGERYEYGSESPTGTIIYGNDVTYSNGVYTLVTTTTSSNWSSDRTTLANGYHYTCFTSGTTCSEVYYITYFEDSSNAYYLTFAGGDTLETAKEKMFTNTNDSTIKTNIDNWYSTNLTSYTNILENTIFCNDRTYADEEFDILSTPWGNGAMYSKDATANGFSGHKALQNVVKGKPSLQCSNIRDRFSLSTTNGGTSGYGNNKLTYSVGLLTYDEANLAGATLYLDSSVIYTNYLNDGSYSWLFSPVDWNGVDAVSGMLIEGSLSGNGVGSSAGVRPVVSLQLGTQFKAGTTGVASNPYVVE